MSYEDFIASKTRRADMFGINIDETHPALFDFQSAIVKWACRRGRAAIFAGCGLGKTIMQLEFARQMGQPTLIVAPLAVAEQTIAEARDLLGMTVRYSTSDDDGPTDGVRITNYEHVEKFSPDKIGTVVLDESSILKSYTGATKRELVERFRDVRYRLACTATPAPNDHMELGNHAEFLSVMGSHEMLSRWFINDTMAAGSYRLKGHAEDDFWHWVASWAVCVHHPSDIGFAQDGYDLPPIQYEQHEAIVDLEPTDGSLFGGSAVVNATSIFKLKRQSAPARAEIAARLANEADGPVVVWCNTNSESSMVAKAVPDAVEVYGSLASDEKRRRLVAFSEGRARVMVTKPSIAGFGLNWQHCRTVVFMGLTYSFEQFYQAVRRTWRFGQAKTVTVHTITDDCAEGEIARVVAEKETEHERMIRNMRDAMRKHHDLNQRDDHLRTAANIVTESGPSWEMRMGDCCIVSQSIPDNHVHLSVFSPPFANLYIYSDHREDMGNSADEGEFAEHYRFLARELLRITKPGRLAAVHCKDLPRYRGTHGRAGLYDFPSDLRRVMEEEGWQYHSRVTIWKDPVIEMQRTKNHGLLYKQLRADSTFSRQGMAEYVIVFRKWAAEDEEVEPVTHTRDDFPLDQWQQWASPVWMDIRQTNVLNAALARSDRDERHICPLQLDLIERCVKLWSNPGDLVFSPFAGIGSEGYEAVRCGRRFLGVELKPEYFRIACRNLGKADAEAGQLTLFDLMATSAD